MRSLFGGRRRSVFGPGKELGLYRNDLFERTERIDARLGQVAEDIEALRRRAIEPEEAVNRLTVHEDALEAESEGIQPTFGPGP